MWQGELLKTIFLDILPLKRQGLVFTWKTLEELHSRIVAATLYECGCADSFRGTRQTSQNDHRTSVLFEPDGSARPLPQADMLLEFTSEEGVRTAVLLSDRERPGTECFVFRYSEDKKRWRWPLTGMFYGPTRDIITSIAVYEPSRLSAMNEPARVAMVRDHSRDAGIAFTALALIREGLLSPVGEAGKSAAEIAARKPAKIAQGTPSSMARAARRRHMTGPQMSGASRS